MTASNSAGPASRVAFRLWPGIAAAVLFVIVRFALPVVMPDALLVGVFVGLALSAAIIVWWLLFSRAPMVERLGAVAMGIAAVYAVSWIVHPSIAGAMMGLMLPIAGASLLCIALVVWAAIASGRPAGLRWILLVAFMFAGAGYFTLIRTDGVLGGGSDLHWRWTPTAEDRLLAEVRDEPVGDPAPASATDPPAPASTSAAAAARSDASPAAPASPHPSKPAEWPGFRGPGRDGVVRGVAIETDWASMSPALLWRRPIGPGWSSFAVDGDLLYTQEQRGEDEIVGCYRVSTGQPVWRHRDRARFWESNGGAGPRGTPTLRNGRVYALGATGILNALDAFTGKLIWSRNAAADTKTQTPFWGFTSSPVVDDEQVIVATSGKLVAYDVATGEPRWFGPVHRSSYSSPHRVTIHGVPQVLMLSADGATSVEPGTGKVLFEFSWAADATPIVQPAVTTDGDVIINAITATGGIGLKRLALVREGDSWKAQERWLSTGLKPYFNDFVVHDGHAYGFDGAILSCIDLADGSRKWKGGRYGSGQLVLLADQNLLLVVGEEGGLALVSATPDGYTEIAKASGIEGKTWNHPVIVRDVLLLRNGEEMAAFRLRRMVR
jgi:outer membrane protein assembly factor BamB